MRIMVLSHMYPNNVNKSTGLFIHNQIKTLMKRGCNIEVISPIPFSPCFLWFNNKWKRYGNIWTSSTYEGVPIICPRYLRIPTRYFWSFSCLTMFRAVSKITNNIIEYFKPDLIHAHNVTPDGYVALKMGNKYNLPVVCSLRGSDINNSPYYGMGTNVLTRRVISEADQIVSVSNGLKKRAEKIAKPKRDIQVVYNGCDSNIFKYDEETRYEYRQKLKISKNDIVVIFVGDLSTSKGILELLEVFRRLKDKHLGLHLVLVGEGKMYAEISRRITNESIDRLYLVGRQEHLQVRNWLCAADIFVLPTYAEGLPNAMLEAMACGLPAVATRVGGIPEVLEDGYNGILINEKDAESLQAGLEHLILNTEKRDQMGYNARRKVENLFTWIRNADDMMDVYNEVLENRMSVR